MKKQILALTQSVLTLTLLSAATIPMAESALARPNDGKTGVNARYISFNPINLEGGYLFANDALSVTSATEFEVGGFYRPTRRTESAFVTDIQNPTADSVMGTITVQVEIGKRPNTNSELDTTKLIPYSVYKVKIQTAGTETVPMTDGETYFTYFGVQKSLVPPIKYGMYMVRSDEKIKTASEQLEQMMTAYRKLCVKFANDCQSSSGFHAWLTDQGITQEHNRKHLEVAVEQYVVFRVEQERDSLLQAGKELSLPRKRELLSAYQGILKKYKTYDPLTKSIDTAYLSKIKREVRLLQLDLADLEK